MQFPRSVSAAALVLAACTLWPALERGREAELVHRRLDALAETSTCMPAVALGAERAGAALASWQTVGGCGAGASSASGAGVKWIGRNVTGGLFHVECQGNYVKTAYGHDWAATTLVSRDLTDRFTLGVSIPYLYKYDTSNPWGQGFDVIDQGVGDVSGMLTYRFGAINDNIVTLSVGAPTGTHDAHLVSAEAEILRQDQQLGAGRWTGSLMFDHVVDNIWGPTVFGGVASWRGGENDLHNYRSPSLTGYWYSSYLLGPFAPALGVAATGWKDHDRDYFHGGETFSPLFSVAPTLSLEYATPAVAVLLGATLPYQYDGHNADASGNPRSPWSWGGWVVALGVAVAPF